MLGFFNLFDYKLKIYFFDYNQKKNAFFMKEVYFSKWPKWKSIFIEAL